MKKILFYINSLHRGGAERVITNLANQFAEHNYETLLLTSYRTDIEFVPNENVQRLSLFDKRLRRVLNRNFKLLSELRKTIKREKPDVIVSFMGEPNVRTILACVGLKVCKIVSIRNDPNYEYAGKLGLFAKLLFKHADGIVFQTKDAKAWFPQKVQDKSRIILNQVDKRFFETKYTEEHKNIVTTGRLEPQKNHELLIRAFALSCKNFDDKLIIYGDGNLREHLENVIRELSLENRVEMPGAIQNVAEKIISAKLFVMSSDFEGLPNSLMEAMALGIPSISTDCPCGGPKMLIDNGIDGWLVPVGDVLAMSKVITYVMKLNSEELKKVEQRTRVKAEAFKTEAVFEEWQDFICSRIEMKRVKNMLITVIYRKLIGEYKYALKHGLKAGAGVSVMGGCNFGSEPYLITIGDNVRISGDVTFVTHDGGTWAFRREKGMDDIVRYGKIYVGDDSFIGLGSIIMPGVKIGKNCVVGAGSIVTRNVPDRTVVAGVPAKIVCTTDEYAVKCKNKMPQNFNLEEYYKNKQEYLEKIL